MLQLIVTTTMMRLVVGRTLATIMELESPESRKMDSVCLRFIRIFFNSIVAPWKLLFAFVPTYQIARGWIAFICSLVLISSIAYGVTKLTDQISCVTGVSPYVIAFAAVAPGKRATQMIRLHAEYQSLRQRMHS